MYFWGYLLVDTYETLQNIDCIDNNNWFLTLMNAEYTCSYLRNCLGVCYHDLRFYTCTALVSRIGWPSEQIFNTVYRKTKFTGNVKIHIELEFCQNDKWFSSNYKTDGPVFSCFQLFLKILCDMIVHVVA